MTAGSPAAARRRPPLRESVVTLWVAVTETLLRLFPFRARTGLLAVGNPGPASPVLLTCNFRLTVQRVRRALGGLDAWLLVANSRGVNVWCAATGGLLTDHDVVSVLKTSGIAERVSHRQLVLPQLAATGIDGRAVHRRSGWRVVWGPVEASDIPAFLADRGRRDRPAPRDPREPEMRAMRTVSFPLLRRLEMAVAWAFPLSLLALLLLPFRPRAVPAAVALVWSLALAVYATFPLYRRWLRATSRRSLAGVAVDVGQLALVLALWAATLSVLWVAGAVGLVGTGHEVAWGLGALLVLLVLGLDLSGSTPIYKSGLQSDRLLAITLDDERCTGAGFCAQVCPKDVFVIDHADRTATLPRADECVQCGACIVQCPFDALTFTAPGGATVEADVVRRYKLNLLGTRSRPGAGA